MDYFRLYCAVSRMETFSRKLQCLTIALKNQNKQLPDGTVQPDLSTERITLSALASTTQQKHNTYIYMRVERRYIQKERTRTDSLILLFIIINTFVISRQSTWIKILVYCPIEHYTTYAQTHIKFECVYIRNIHKLPITFHILHNLWIGIERPRIQVTNSTV